MGRKLMANIWIISKENHLKFEYPNGEMASISTFKLSSLLHTNSSLSSLSSSPCQYSSNPYALSGDLATATFFSGEIPKTPAAAASATAPISSTGIPWFTNWKNPMLPIESKIFKTESRSDDSSNRKSILGGFSTNLCLGKMVSGKTRSGTRSECSRNSVRTSSFVTEERRLVPMGDGGGARNSKGVAAARSGDIITIDEKTGGEQGEMAIWTRKGFGFPTRLRK